MKVSPGIIANGDLSTHKNVDMDRPVTSTIPVTNTANQFKLI
jgi:hypothetical protein